VLTPQQESTLTSAGDSFDHYHSSDRVVTHQTLRDLQQQVAITTAPSVYAVVFEDDVILCPVATALQLPPAKVRRQFSVVRTGAGNVVCTCAGTDTVFGAPSVTLTTLGQTFNFMAVPGGWILL